MKVHVFRPVDGGEPVLFEADAVTVEENPTGTLVVTRFEVAADGELVTQGSCGYAHGRWEGFAEVEMMALDVKERLRKAEQRDNEAEDAKTLRTVSKF